MDSRVVLTIDEGVLACVVGSWASMQALVNEVREMRQAFDGLRGARPVQADAPGVEPAPASPEDRVGTAQIAKRLGVSRRTVGRYRRLKHDPLPHEPSNVGGKGPGKCVYLMTKVEAWWARYQARASLKP
jgi:hypothetical protein